MRTVPSSLGARLATGSAKAAWCYKLETKTNAVFRFTEGDTEATFGGDDTYVPYSGMLGGTVTYGIAGQAAGIELQFGVTDTASITPADIRDGLFDAAELTIWEYDLDSPGDGRVEVFWGRVNDITRRTEGKVKFSAKGILAQTYQILIERYMPMCIWFFCDSRCGLDPNAYTYAATLTGIAADRFSVTVSGPASTRPVDAFKDGIVTLPDGRNIAVRGNSGGTILLHLTLPSVVIVGDALSVMQGCQKRFVDCQAYGNQLRFGGQPRAGSPEEAASITYSDWS